MEEPPANLQMLSFVTRREDQLDNYGTVPSKTVEHIATQNQKISLFVSQLRGTFWALMCGAFYCGVGTTVKYLPSYHMAELGLYSHVWIVILALPLGDWRLPKTWKYYFLALMASSTETLCNITRYGAYQRIPLGDATAITFNTPIFTAIISRLFIRERLTRFVILALFISILATCCTVKLPDLIRNHDDIEGKNKRQAMGYIFAFGSVLLASLSNIFLRKLTAATPSVNLMFMGLFGTAISAVFLPAFGKPQTMECSKTSWILLAFCLAQAFAIICLVYASSDLQAAYFSILLRSSDIILSFIVQVTVFAEPVDAYSASGAVLYTLSGLFIPLQHWMQTLPDNSIWKPKWWLK